MTAPKLTPDTVEEFLAALVKGGGPAFPSRMESVGAEFNGMTLRDYFAGQAATALTAGLVAQIHAGFHEDINNTVSGVAKIAYAISDALLIERRPK